VIKSVKKAMDILCAFEPDRPVMGVQELSDQLDLPKSTLHHLLATLAKRGFIENNERGQYSLGSRIIERTQAVRLNVELRDRAAPLLRSLADACRLSVYLAALDGMQSIYIYAVETPHRLRARTAVGDRVPLHCTSLGKAMLAFLAPEEIERIVATIGLERFTDNTIVDPTRLKEELGRVRQLGYAVDRQEHELGVGCVGAPIFSHRRAVVAACSVSGTPQAIADDSVERLASLVMNTGEEISTRLGYLRPRGQSVVRLGGATSL